MNFRTKPGGGGAFAALAAAVLALAVLYAGPLNAQDAAFTVEGVAIDETADSAVAAKEAGLDNAKAEALSRMLQRLTLQESWDQLPTLPGDQIDSIIRTFSLADERFGGQRYLASLTVDFDPAAIRRLLEGAGIPYAETSSRPMLVLPVQRADGAPAILWDEGNSWLGAWAGRERTGGLVPFIIPLGDLSDVSAITAEEAIAGDTQALNRIATRYGAGGVIVSSVEIAPANDAENRLIDGVTVVYGPGWTADPIPGNYQASMAADLPSVLTRVANNVVDDLQERWKQQNLIAVDAGATALRLTVPLRDLGGWIDIRRRLERTAPVREVTVAELSTSAALIDVRYVGAIEQLQLALGQRGLMLERSLPDGALVLRSTQ